MSAKTALLDVKQLPKQGCFIDNAYRDATGSSLTLINPKDKSHIQDFNEASQEDVDAAVVSATNAFKSGPWATFTGAQRGKCLNKLADLVEEYGQPIAYWESMCSGRPLTQVQYSDIPRCAGVLRYYAGWADKIKGDSYPPDDGFYKIVEHTPVGVCGAITAWNASLHFLSWKCGPALACGNTVILKPSEKSPLGSLAIGSLIEAAGFPPGVFNIVVGGRVAGSVMASHMDIAKISFTGSTATGKSIQAAATKSNLKRVTLELGGKSPAIVFEDANIDTAVFWSILGITVNTGQVCAATSRVYVQEAVADAFIEKMSQRFEQIAKDLGGDPQEPGTSYGPLIDKDQFEKVQKFIEEGKENATVVIGGEATETAKGYYLAPVIFKDPKTDSKIYKEEIFGPVLCIKTFKTEEEVLQLANDSHYGLAGSVYTRDLARALRVGRKIEGGTIGINCSSMVGPQVPMGGFKSSGMGRELGEYAIRHYTEPRTLWINMNG